MPQLLRGQLRGPVNLNHRFFRGSRIASPYSIFELNSTGNSAAEKVLCLYDQARQEGSWKYDPPEMVLRALEHVPNYHILAAMDGETIAGTVRSILLPRSSVVFGSCLVVNPEYRRRGLAIPLIMAAMSRADTDSLIIGANGIFGAVLGVDDSPEMRAFHAQWGVKYLDPSRLPFVFPPASDSGATERTFGIRLEDDSSEISSMQLRRVLSDLSWLQLSMGYGASSVAAIYARQFLKLVGVRSLPLVAAEQYSGERSVA